MRKHVRFDLVMAILMAVLGCIGLWVVTILWSQITVDTEYAGRAIFYTEEDLARFKTQLVDSRATWEKSGLDVTFETPPTIVDFDVFVSRSRPFPYGTEILWPQSRITVAFGAIMLLLGGLVLSGLNARTSVAKAKQDQKVRQLVDASKSSLPGQ